MGASDSMLSATDRVPREPADLPIGTEYSPPPALHKSDEQDFERRLTYPTSEETQPLVRQLRFWIDLTFEANTLIRGPSTRWCGI
jgi:hypothetical protein